MKDETCSGHPMQENLALEERKMDHGRNGFWRLAEKSDLALKSQRGLFPSTITCHYLIKMLLRVMFPRRRHFCRCACQGQ
ncbi:hypothetical protein CsSME_00039419 [Camellia sinensis var. sinensis]